MNLKTQKASIFKKIVFLLGLGLYGFIPYHLCGESTGYNYIKNYSYTDDYQHQAQNWGIAQDKNGIIFVANNGGVLTFDGVSWKIIGIPGYATARSLAIDDAGTVYIGGEGEIGYLTPDKTGLLKYVSLVNHLDEKYRSFGPVWRTNTTEDGIYFCPSEFLARWEPGTKKMTVVKPSTRFLNAYTVMGKLWVHQDKVGLMEVNNNSLTLLPGGDLFADPQIRISMIVPFDTVGNTTRLLVGTRSNGFFLHDRENFTPFPTGVDEYLMKNFPLHGTRISTGDFAITTRDGGLVIMDSFGNPKRLFDKTAGLQENNAKYVFEDNQGNVWLCLEKGISKIEYSSPLFLFDARNDLTGIVNTVIRHGGDIYAGTTVGLFVLPSGSDKFRPAATGTPANCWSLLSTGDSLFAGFSNGVFRVDGKTGRTEMIIADWTYALLQSRHFPGTIWCGTSRNGLVALIKKNGRWVEEQRFAEINQDIRSMTEDKSGNLWLGTLNMGALKVNFPTGSNNTIIHRYDAKHKLPGGEIYVAWAAGHVMFATSKGLFRFDEKKKTFSPDHTLGDQYASGSKNSKPVFRIVEDNDRHIWFHSESKNYQAVPGPGKKYTIDSNPFSRIPTIQGNVIYLEPDGNMVWFGNFEGLIRYDKTIKKKYDLVYSAYIREVLINNETSIYSGYEMNNRQNFSPILPYNGRKLSIKYAAPFFENESATQYRFFLEGSDKSWSEWAKASQKEYTNINPGNHILKIQAQNVYGALSRPAIFQFKVLGPWYLMWWAFILYIFLFIGLLYFAMHLRAVKLEHEKKRLELEKQKLEQTVKERTAEINEKNRKLENQSAEINEKNRELEGQTRQLLNQAETLQNQAEKLKEMDNIKSRFFANISHEFRTPLTLIMSPLEEMLSVTPDNQQKKRLNLMLRSSQGLLILVNQLLELSRIDSGKVKLHTSRQDIIPFLKAIISSFRILTERNQLDLEFQNDADSIFLYFDYQKMEEVLNNLLINAVKFTPEGGKIMVSVRLVKGETGEPGTLATAAVVSDFVEISVQDTGVGIPVDQLPHIFDRFHQVPGSIPRDSAHKGTGIGLALVKELVSLHHGKTTVSSSEGKGTTFIIQLPMGTSHLLPEEIVESSYVYDYDDDSKRKKTFDIATSMIPEEDVEEVGDSLPTTATGTDDIEGTTEGITGENGQEEKTTILLVEDHTDVRKYIRQSLEPLYKVIEASDGSEGIDKAKEITPDLIVSDVMMPGKDGFQLARELKQDFRTSHIPIILLTAKASEEEVMDGLATGADDYITKPFNSRILLTRIKNLIDLRRQIQLTIQRRKTLLPSEIKVSSIDDQFLEKFHKIIEENLDDQDFRIDDLYKELKISRTNFFNKIKALTGETPNQFILTYRLERAAQILRKDKSKKVTDIALDVGFDSPAYFAKCFRDRFNQSPSSFQASKLPSSTEKSN